MLVQNYYAFASQTFFAPIFLIQNFQNMSKQNQNISKNLINEKKNFSDMFFFTETGLLLLIKYPKKICHNFGIGQQI